MSTSTEVSFLAQDGSRLAGVLTLPKKKPLKKLPAVLLCQGFSGVKYIVLPTVAQQLAAAGFASLAFDYRGYGESEGEKGWISPLSRLEDAVCAFAYLAARREVDAKKMGIYGLSYGGPIAISLAAQEPCARAAVAVSGPGNGEKFMRARRSAVQWKKLQADILADRELRARTGRSAWVDFSKIYTFSAKTMKAYSALKKGAQSSMKEKGPPKKYWFASADAMLHFHPEQAAELIRDCPTLYVNGEKDDIATVAQVKEMHRRTFGRKKMVILPGCTHTDLDAGPGLDVQIGLAIRWFEQNLTKKK